MITLGSSAGVSQWSERLSFTFCRKRALARAAVQSPAAVGPPRRRRDGDQPAALQGPQRDVQPTFVNQQLRGELTRRDRRRVTRRQRRQHHPLPSGHALQPWVDHNAAGFPPSRPPNQLANLRPAGRPRPRPARDTRAPPRRTPTIVRATSDAATGRCAHTRAASRGCRALLIHYRIGALPGGHDPGRARATVAASRTCLKGSATRLCAGERCLAIVGAGSALSPHGVAMVARLLTDGLGPLYAPDSPAALHDPWCRSTPSSRAGRWPRLTRSGSSTPDAGQRMNGWAGQSVVNPQSGHFRRPAAALHPPRERTSVMSLAGVANGGSHA